MVLAIIVLYSLLFWCTIIKPDYNITTWQTLFSFEKEQMLENYRCFSANNVCVCVCLFLLTKTPLWVMRNKLINPYTLVTLEVWSTGFIQEITGLQNKQTNTSELFSVLSLKWEHMFSLHYSCFSVFQCFIHFSLWRRSSSCIVEAQQELVLSSLGLHGLLGCRLLVNCGVSRKLTSCPKPLLAWGWCVSHSPVNVGRRRGSHGGNRTGTDALWGSQEGEHGQSVREVGGSCWGVGRCAHLEELEETSN